MRGSWGRKADSSSHAQASVGLDTLVEWLLDPDGCLDQFTMAACVCSGVRSQNHWLLRVNGEGCWKQLCTLTCNV